MSVLCSFIAAPAAASAAAARPTAAASRCSSSVSSSCSSAHVAAAKSVMLGGVRLGMPSTSARAARHVHRRRGAVVTRAAEEQGNLNRDNPLLNEKFATIGTGEHECQSCMYTYTPQKGDDFYPVAAGTPFKDLPGDWRCPTCGAEKSTFKNLGKKVSGFEQNQGYGLGTNSMTGGEKSILIYGSLAVFFFLFLGGYLLD